MTEKSAHELSEWTHWLPDLQKPNQPLVCFGGRIFTENPDFINQVEGVFLGKTLEEGIITLDKMLHDMFPNAR